LAKIKPLEHWKPAPIEVRGEIRGGTLFFTCPFCGHSNTRKLPSLRFNVEERGLVLLTRCHNRTCRRLIEVRVPSMKTIR